MSNPIDRKLDKIQEDVLDIKLTLERNTLSLEEHIRRTTAAEKRIEMLTEQDLKLEEEVNKKLAPISDHVKMVNWTFKLLATAGAVLLVLDQLGILKLALTFGVK
jgi:hypothetical protein